MNGEDQEKMRRDYEYKIATMQSRIQGLELDLRNAEDQGRRMGEERVRQMEEELDSLRRVCLTLA
jgi:protein SPA2